MNENDEIPDKIQMIRNAFWLKKKVDDWLLRDSQALMKCFEEKEPTQMQRAYVHGRQEMGLELMRYIEDIVGGGENE